MFYRAISAALVAATLLLAGCAGPAKMPFSDETNSSIQPDKAVFLLTATIRNAHKPSHQPEVRIVAVEKGSREKSSGNVSFKVDSKGTEGNTYLVRMELERGEYVMRGLHGMSSSFPIHGFFFAPMHANIVSSEPGIYYLGHVEAVARAREPGDFKAGPMIPLIDQAIAGASTGTFDVVISDRWATDERRFKNKFPVLKNAEIKMAILPPFDRAFAQKYWEAN